MQEILSPWSLLGQQHVKCSGSTIWKLSYTLQFYFFLAASLYRHINSIIGHWPQNSTSGPFFPAPQRSGGGAEVSNPGNQPSGLGDLGAFQKLPHLT